MQTRAGQIAGFGAVLLALIGGNAATILDQSQGGSRAAVAAMLIGAALCLAVSVAVAVVGVSRTQSYAEISADEIANYLTEPFLDAPELWRVQVRSLRTINEVIEDAQKRANDATEIDHRFALRFLGGPLRSPSQPSSC